MQSIYQSYRDMKRTIRDISAIDIQRFTRSFLVRVKLKRQRSVNVEIEVNTNANADPISSEDRLNHSKAKQLTSDLLSDNENAIGPVNSLEILNRYKELQLLKRDIKRQLKRFDDEFASKHGRSPKKSDKEV